jgi:hypothetical protein
MPASMPAQSPETAIVPQPGPAVEHSSTGICTLAPERPHADVGICRACFEQGLFDALLNGATAAK